MALNERSIEVELNHVTQYTQGEVMSPSLWSRYERHFVGITRYNALSEMAKIYCVIKIKLNQFKKMSI